jgi:hypothetical protein
MEEHVVAANLQESRARLRELLVPDPETGRIEADQFPRSAVMRFVFDPRGRKVAMTGLSLLMMLAGRKAAARTGLMPLLSQSLASLVRLARR